ncbi:glycosyltransferase family 4 protein [Mucilaginibacter boryungensis]|uniref:Glycosyltransferase family 4 protein n=1 Tax=Mucilaginibacter boryungensis TaxID=768480 RepID=A0ABR9XKF4_9SPHI|nr:glycosyltransferase family 4 protein [Mucilaginibacter boryungensis]MBE9667887.1 glycosyltransferase family 4 protein [Mucilaginibacter boryungensis]
MNILILHGTSDLYGGSKILYTVADFLRKKYGVTVILSEEGPLADVLREHGIEVIIMKMGILRRKYLNPKGLINRVRALTKAKREIKEIVESKNIQLLYSNTTGVLIGAYVANSCKIKHIWHIHEIIEKPALFTKFIGWHIKKFADLVIVVSNEVKKHWEKYLDANIIHTVYNGIDYQPIINAEDGLRDELQLTNDDILIGMIGRVNLWKGQKYFLEITTLLCKKYPNVKFVMVGDVYPGYEYLYDEIKQIIDNNKLEKNVYNLGYRTDIPYILKGLDIFILPSILPDPLPTVILEAMAAGKPVVATKHGGAIEMVQQGKTGALIPWDNAEQAVDSISAIIEDPTLRINMGEAGKKRALDNFSLPAFEKNVFSLIDSLNIE